MSDFIETPKKQYNKKPVHHIKVVDWEEKQKMENKKERNATISLHKKEIKELRIAIRKHKLMIKQAKLYYNICK